MVLLALNCHFMILYSIGVHGEIWINKPGGYFKNTCHLKAQMYCQEFTLRTFCLFMPNIKTQSTKYYKYAHPKAKCIVRNLPLCQAWSGLFVNAYSEFMSNIALPKYKKKSQKAWGTLRKKIFWGNRISSINSYCTYFEWWWWEEKNHEICKAWKRQVLS